MDASWPKFTEKFGIENKDKHSLLKYRGAECFGMDNVNSYITSHVIRYIICYTLFRVI